MRRVLAVAPTAVPVRRRPRPGGHGHPVAARQRRRSRCPRSRTALEAGPSTRAEQAALPAAFRQAQALTTLGDTPLVVLTAKDNVDAKPGWGTAQDQMAALSTNSRHTVADLAHVGLLTDPAGAAAVRHRHHRRRHRRPHPRRLPTR